MGEAQEPTSVAKSADIQSPELADRPRWASVHIWQIQWVRDLVVIAAIIAVVYVGYLIRVVTVPLLLGLLLAYLFEPVVRWLRGRRICSRQFAAIGIIALAALVIVLPVTLGSTFAVAQGARAVRDIAGNLTRVQKSVAAPSDDELRSAVPKGAWREIRDFLVEQPAPPPSTPDPAPNKPSADTEQTATPDGTTAPPPAASEGIMARLTDGQSTREVARSAIDWLGSHIGDISATIGKSVATGGADAARAALSTLGSIGLIIFQGALTAVFFYFLSTGWGQVQETWQRFVPDDRRARVASVLSQMDRAIAGFVRGRVTISFILGIALTIMYWLAGVPAPLVLGPVVGILFLIPYVHGVGVPIAMLLMWLEGVRGPILAPELAAASGGWWYILAAPIIIYVLAQVFDDWVLSPAIQGKATELAIPTIVFASLAGGALAGIYGLLLAIPVAACLRILMKEFFWPRLKAWARGEASDLLPIGRE